MKIKTQLLPTFLMLTSVALLGQTYDPDSTLAFIQNTDNDSARTLSKVKMGFHFIFNDKERAWQFIKDALADSEKYNLPYGTVNATSVKGIYFDVEGQYDSARYYFEKALALSQTHKFLDMEVKLQNNLGMYCWNRGLYTEALAYFFNSLEANRKVDGYKKMDESIALNNIGLIYQEMGVYEKALEYHQQALEIRKANPKSKRNIAISLNNIGICMRHLERYEASEKSFMESIQYCEESQFETQKHETYSNLGHLYTELKQHNKSLKYNLKALSAPKEVALRNNFLMNIHASVAGNYIQLNNPAKALEYSRLALKFLADDASLSYYASSVLQNAALSYYLNGMPDSGLYYNLKLEKLHEEIFSEDLAEQTAQMETKYQTALKENQILTLEQEKEGAELKIAKIELEKNRKNTLFYFTAGFAFLIISTGVAWFRWKQFKIKTENTLTLQNAMFLSEQNERVRIARDLHDSIGQKLAVQKMMLGQLETSADAPLRQQLQKMADHTDETISEVRNITHNLIPEEMNLGLLKALEDTAERINATSNVKVSLNFKNELPSVENLPMNRQLTIYRIVQEVVGNMLKHANATNIEILLKQLTGHLELAISDNGKGFDPREIRRNEGLGWKNTIARVKVMSGHLKISSQKGRGTQVHILIPIK